jgi:hypothetical protein
MMVEGVKRLELVLSGGRFTVLHLGCCKSKGIKGAGVGPRVQLGCSLNTHMCTHTMTCTHMHTRTHMHVNICLCLHTYTNLHTQTQSHTHIHTHTFYVLEVMHRNIKDVKILLSQPKHLAYYLKFPVSQTFAPQVWSPRDI